jgi:hypothetical protein
MTMFGPICPIMAGLVQDWNDTSGFALRGTICLHSTKAAKNGL